jgi:hypothetical protein
MIIRTYRCDDCEQEFEVHCESSDGDPDCPTCAKVLDWQPGMFSITGHKSRAIDVTQKIIEEDFGLSNLKDNTREGEAAYKEPRADTTHEKEKITQAVMEYVRESTGNAPGAASVQLPAPVGFNWGTQVAGAPAPQVSMQHVLSQAKVGPQAAENPMQILQSGIKSGHLKTKSRIIAKWSP